MCTQESTAAMIRAGAFLLVCAAALAWNAAQAGPVYRWVDAQGHVHYTQTPPPASIAKAKSMNISPPQPDQTSLTQTKDMEQAVNDRQVLQKAQADKAQKAADKKAKQEEACKKARFLAQQYVQVRRVRKPDKNGKPEYYSGDDLVKLRQQAQAQADKICNGG